MEDLGVTDANDLNESIEEIKMTARKWEAKAKKLAPLEVWTMAGINIFLIIDLISRMQ